MTQRRILKENHGGNILRMSVPAKALSRGIFKLDKLRYDRRDRYWPHVPLRKSARCDFVIILFRSMAPGISRRYWGTHEMFSAVRRERKVEANNRTFTYHLISH